MRSFSTIQEEALFRLGSEAELRARLPKPLPPHMLRKQADTWYFSLMSRRIFRAGLKHSMVDAKWPAFEEVFHQFDVGHVSSMSDEALQSLMEDRRIIRHWGKLRAVRTNALAITELYETGKSLADYLADWPTDRIVLLWLDLKERFAQLGGNSGPYFLRMAGKDTFLMTDFVQRALIKWGAIRNRASGKKAMLAVQDIMNRWADESGRPLCQVSMILALSVD